jgi:molecular chaperone IbpA
VFGELSNFNQNQTSSYPPYNLKKDGDDYIIELAVAGLNEEDITVNVENGVLTVESTTDKSDEDFLYQGIAKRSFKRCWTLSDDIIVKGAALDAGMLTIKMEKIIPEEKKAKQIKIVTNQKKLS